MARVLLATLLVVMLACGAAADMARPPARRLMGKPISSSDAKKSSGTAAGNTASATATRTASSTSAKNDKVSASASHAWTVDRSHVGAPDMGQGNVGWTNYKP